MLNSTGVHSLAKESTLPVIDFRVRPRTEYFYRNLVPDVIPAFRAYVKMFHIEPRLKVGPLEESVAEMTAGDVTHGVIFSGNAKGNLEVFEACRRFPDCYFGLAGIDITEGVTQGMLDLEKAYDELGLSGLGLSPFMTGIRADDPRYFPLYALSEKAGRMVQIHSAAHFNPAVPLEVAAPGPIDRLAIEFPKLRLVISHAGFGFGDLGLSIALRHRNVFADFSGLHPKNLPSGWLARINGPLRSKAIFGTNYPCLSFDVVDAWRAVLRPEVQDQFFYLNAVKALGVEL